MSSIHRPSSTTCRLNEETAGTRLLSIADGKTATAAEREASANFIVDCTEYEFTESRYELLFSFLSLVNKIKSQGASMTTQQRGKGECGRCFVARC